MKPCCNTEPFLVSGQFALALSARLAFRPYETATRKHAVDTGPPPRPRGAEAVRWLEGARRCPANRQAANPDRGALQGPGP